MTPTIPFNQPYHTERSLELVADAVRRGHLSGDGHHTRVASGFLAELTGARRALLTTSCTAALEMAALLLDVADGDEVIVPSFTFVSSVNAFVLRGATPVFVDVRPDTLNIDETKVESAISPRTRAIVGVHYAGVGCELDVLGDLAGRHGVALVEDNAHGLGGTWQGRPLGSFGQLATVSFHETKNLHCGEGGALLVNDEAMIERAEIIREKGTDRSRFFRGEVDKYTWVDIGSSYLPSDIAAAYLCGQLEEREWIQQQRTTIWQAYASELAGWAAEHGIGLPVVPAAASHPAHLFYLLLPTAGARTRFIDHMRGRGIHTVFHYVPLHSSPMGQRLAPGTRCPVTDDVAARLVRLPLYPALVGERLDAVVEAAMAFRP